MLALTVARTNFAFESIEECVESPLGAERTQVAGGRVEIALHERHQMIMTWRMGRWMGVAIAIALGLFATGCAKATPQEQMQAAIEARCKSGKGPCPNRENLETTVKCQAGDAAACQHLAVASCESGDRLSCQSLAVTYRELKPLCDKGDAVACRGMNLEWPSSAKWNPEQEIAQAESDCRAGKRAACRALRTHAQVFGDRIIWTQSYIAPRNQ